MMKCTNCDGTGKEKLYDKLTNAYLLIKCAYCNGSGELLQTNEEWRKTCSAEDFTEKMVKVICNIVAWNNDPKPSEVRTALKAWLKQPHSEE